MRNINMTLPDNLGSLEKSLVMATENSRIIAGGTDLIIAINEGEIVPDLLIDVSCVAEMKKIIISSDVLSIGAACCFSDIVENGEVNRYFPAISAAAAGVGSKQIRNRATIGGNIANASPAGDMLPVLMCLSAAVVLLDSNGAVFKKTVDEVLDSGIAPNEVIISVEISLPEENSRNRFVKLGSRKAVSISKISLGANFLFHEANMVENAIIYIGAVGKKPIFANQAASLLKGKELNEHTIREFCDALSEDITMAIPNRPSVHYKKEAIRGLAEDIALSLCPNS